MNGTARRASVGWMAALVLAAAATTLVAPAAAAAQALSWTRDDLVECTGKFDEGKYKSSEIYGTPRDPQLKKDYEEYLKNRLAELRAKRGAAK
jgi:hypothetical protein